MAERLVIWVKCTGEAHQRGNMADHCMVCLPYWGDYPTCPVCGSKVRHGGQVLDRLARGLPSYRFYCPSCKKHCFSDR